MDKPSHPEPQGSPPPSPEHHLLTLPTPEESISEVAMYHSWDSSVSLQTEAGQDPKREGLWSRTKKALTTSSTQKVGGSKTSLKTMAVGKKSLTPIPEASGLQQRQTPESTATETTLQKTVESSALGPPPQIPPVQTHQTPFDIEWQQASWVFTREEAPVARVSASRTKNHTPVQTVTLPAKIEQRIWDTIEDYNPDTPRAHPSTGELPSIPAFTMSVAPQAFASPIPLHQRPWTHLYHMLIKSTLIPRDAQITPEREAQMEQARAIYAIYKWYRELQWRLHAGS
ncbi:uncharacterized protein EV420DRAFT_1485133 [Desarmillaria tabescens]|uniref:Uncharacterized protein n=1 Tax=Armillaria tabescens TaxID=1929756 RepID=A0AA39JMC2_ARMTA|nr:uncharacterized protein EV420DRAFT_1485133 [Desarmillaria tabescens]KAK0443023.1 hypothetical protein EV420DRAFT_1485133 [Desarmillaria tabescens]